LIDLIDITEVCQPDFELLKEGALTLAE